MLGGYLKQAVEIVMAAPALAPVVKEFLLITARTFRAGKALEETLERSFDAAIKEAQAARQQAQQQGNPETMLAKQELQLEAEKAKAGHGRRATRSAEATDGCAAGDTPAEHQRRSTG